MRTQALLALLALPAPAGAWCLLACDQVLQGAAAEARASAVLGLTLPSGAKVVGLVEGGFQDRFVQARIEVPGAVLDAALKPFGTSSAALGPMSDEAFGPEGPDWWDPDGREAMRVAFPRLQGFAYATLGVAPSGKGMWTLYLWAFQT